MPTLNKMPNLDSIQYRINSLIKKRAKLKKEKDKAFVKWNKEPTEENMKQFEELRRKHIEMSDTIHRLKNRLRYLGRINNGLR